MASGLGRRPSGDPHQLMDQLLRELARLQAGDLEEPELYRAYLFELISKTWYRTAQGERALPGLFLDRLREASDFTDRFHQEVSDPKIKAAWDVDFTMTVLELAARALEMPIYEGLLREPSATALEREILSVLFGERGRYLRRGEIYDRLKGMPDRPTAQRVGQVLSELYERGLTLRIQGVSQGSGNTAFYALSKMGQELCHRVGIVRKGPKLGVLDKTEFYARLREALDVETEEPARFSTLFGGNLEEHAKPWELHQDALKRLPDLKRPLEWIFWVTDLSKPLFLEFQKAAAQHKQLTVLALTGDDWGKIPTTQVLDDEGLEYPAREGYASIVDRESALIRWNDMRELAESNV